LPDTSIEVYDPEGKHLKDITFSGKNITCPTWGGNNLDLLFVISGRREPDGIDEGGVVFRYKVSNGPKGTIKHEFAG
jgi:sugar lactone lactonase YvrE